MLRTPTETAVDDSLQVIEFRQSNRRTGAEALTELMNEFGIVRFMAKHSQYD